MTKGMDLSPTTPLAPQRMGIFVAGVQKAGTSALHAYLARHPDLCPPPRKELHFFDDEAREWRWPCDGALDALAPGNGRPRWEATPITLFWPGALERLAAYNPFARLIVLFRDPVARAWSQWCMECARGDETLPFGAAIRREALAGEHALRHHSYIDRGRYGAQLARALALFPRRQMLLLRHADLAEDPATTLRHVTDFLGIAPFASVAPLRANERPAGDWGEGPCDADRAWMMDALAEDHALFRRLSGLELTDEAKGSFRRAAGTIG